MSKTKPTIAVVNSNQDTTEMLRASLQDHGFTSVVIAHVTEIKRGVTDVVEFVQTHEPEVFVWDISLPYEENWRFVHMLMGHEAIRGRRFVLTTTNKRALESLVGKTEALEIVGKPYDLQQVITAVRRASGEPVPPELQADTQ